MIVVFLGTVKKRNLSEAVMMKIKLRKSAPKVEILLVLRINRVYMKNGKKNPK